MFSLRLPIALKITLITYPPPKTTTNIATSSHYHYSCSQSHRFPSHPMLVTKHGSGTTAAAPIPNTAIGYEEEGRSSSLDEDLLLMPAELKEELMPKHVAMIMDGNRRWAKTRGLPPLEGYVALVQPLRRVVKLCLSWGIKIFTVFFLSTENLVLRPKVIISFSFVVISNCLIYKQSGVDLLGSASPELLKFIPFSMKNVILTIILG